MPISGIGTTAGTAAAVANAATANGLGKLGGDAFLQLLVAQLKYQNPMQPTDGAAMLQQTAQFTQVETLKKLADAQAQLLGYHQAAVASSMVGQQVIAVDADGIEFTGIVDRVRFTADGPFLCMGDREFSLESAREIRPAGTPAVPSPSVTD